MWNNLQIKQHKLAAQKLIQTKDETFDFIRKKQNVTEYEVQQFVLKRFKRHNLVTDKDPPIIAFGRNTSKVHYFPKRNSKRLTKNTLILIDLWAKLNSKKAPFADITWMAYFGKSVPKEILANFDLVIKIRDKIIQCLKKSLIKKKIHPGKFLEQLTKQELLKNNLSNKMNHYTGHCLGTSSCHGNKKGINPKNKSPLLKNLGYTIEPGIYLKNKFGIRSEIDFYISTNSKLIITTKIQKSIVLL